MSFQPRTPQSPSQHSPNTSGFVSSMNSSMTSTTSTLPTPAHSVNGSSVALDSTHDIVMGEDSPQKRKRSIGDDGDREQKKAHLEQNRLGIEDLHQDVGEKYLLCKTPHRVPNIRVDEDLFAAFGLTDIAANVARFLPNGQKNSLRKTYKGHIKNLGVNGHFDSDKREIDAPDSFWSLMAEPEDSWHATKVKGKEIESGLGRTVEEALKKAMTMAKGPIPKTAWDSSVLGDLSSEKNASFAKHKVTAPNTPLHPSVPRSKAPMASAAQEAARPKRSIKKRSYGDSSFEGYGEGFPDDDGGMDTGYSTGEGEGGVKRRKKNPGPSQFTAGPMRQQSYGPGMVGA